MEGRINNQILGVKGLAYLIKDYCPGGQIFSWNSNKTLYPAAKDKMICLKGGDHCTRLLGMALRYMFDSFLFQSFKYSCANPTRKMHVTRFLLFELPLRLG